MADFVAYRDIACVYPISGQYGNIPRWLYYFVLIGVILLRDQEWLAVGAAATCLTFGGGAAVHALILASIPFSTSSLIPDGFVQLPSGQKYWVNAAFLDLDTDGTLAVVGVGFLITLPMALWSSEFRQLNAKSVLVLWTILMFIGMIGCLVKLYGVDATPDGPYRQYRFCPAGANDTLPLSGTINFDFSEGDWNATIWNHFSKDGAAYLGCVYPCFSTRQILRSQSEMTIIDFPELLPSNPQYWSVCLVAAFVYGFVPATMLFCLVVLILNLLGLVESSSAPRKKSKVLAYFHLGDRFMICNLALRLKGAHEKLAFKFLFWVINGYAKILTPLLLIAFVIWIEWTITLDIQAETYQDVGQWTPPLYFGLVIVSAFVGKFWHKEGRLLVIRNWWRRTFGDVRLLHASPNIEEATGELELQPVDQSR